MPEDLSIAPFVRHFSESDASRIAFSWNGKDGAEFYDANLEFRSAVTEHILKNPGAAPVSLLRTLFKAHAECSFEAWGAPLNFGELGALLLLRGGPGAIDDFASGFDASFDTFGACHQMVIDPVALRNLSQHVNAELELESSEERRKQLGMVQELFAKLSEGTAGEGWGILQPGITEVRIVGRARLAWLRLKESLQRLFTGR